MKKIFFTYFLLLQCFLYAQITEIKVVDITTHKPIGNAEAFYVSLLKGSISNDEGNLQISVEKDTLTVSHIGYETKKISPEKLNNLNTIYLTPQLFFLDEVTVYNFDLKKKISYVLDNYYKLYDTDAKILECTYREKFIRNDSLTRLYQVQLDWWSKIYRFSPKEKLDKLLQIRLKNTDYSKMLEEKTVPTRSMHLERRVMFMYLFLNTYLSLINKYGENLEIKKIEKDKEHTKITFNADIVINQKPQLQLTNSVIYFDNVTNAVKKLIFNDTKQETVDKISEKGKIPYKSVKENYCSEITFTNYKNKLFFSSFQAKFIGGVEYKQQKDKLSLEYSFLRTGVQYKRIKKEDRIDIKKSFHEYITPHKPSEAHFLLTSEEMDFINL